MQFNRKSGIWLQRLLLGILAALIGHLSLPTVLPSLVPETYLPVAVLAVAVAQKFLHDRAWEFNWDGSQAETAAPPDPVKIERLRDST